MTATPQALFQAPTASGNGKFPLPDVPPDNRPRHRSALEWLPVGSIGHDQAVNTRPVNGRWVEGKAGEFDWDLLGIVTVAEDQDGTRVFLDGQQRGALVLRVAGPEAEMKCEVYRNISREQKARLFLGLNSNRPVTPVSRFLAEVTAGDPVAVAIAAIATDTSWRIDLTGSQGALQCVNRLRAIHQADLDRYQNGGPEPMVLRDTLSVLDRAWGHADRNGHELLVFAVSQVLQRDGQKIRKSSHQEGNGLDRMVKCLQDTSATPSLMLDQARSQAAIAVPRMTSSATLRQMVVSAYNYRMHAHSKRLADFRPRN